MCLPYPRWRLDGRHVGGERGHRLLRTPQRRLALRIRPALGEVGGHRPRLVWLQGAEGVGFDLFEELGVGHGCFGQHLPGTRPGRNVGVGWGQPRPGLHRELRSRRGVRMGPLPPACIEPGLDLSQPHPQRAERDRQVVHDVRRLLGGSAGVAVGAGGHQLGHLLPQLLQPEIPVGEELPGVARRRRARRSLPHHPVQPGQRRGVLPGFPEAADGSGWQAGPAGTTSARTASRSQSAVRRTTRCTFPLVSPFRHSPRVREV